MLLNDAISHSGTIHKKCRLVQCTEGVYKVYLINNNELLGIIHIWWEPRHLDPTIEVFQYSAHKKEFTYVDRHIFGKNGITLLDDTALPQALWRMQEALYRIKNTSPEEDDIDEFPPVSPFLHGGPLG